MALTSNQFDQSLMAGMVDQRYSYSTISVQFDTSEPATGILPGTAVKGVDSAGGVPKVLAVTADADDVIGFLNYDIRHAGFQRLDFAEISQDGNIIYLKGTGAIARNASVVLDVAGGGVKAATGTTDDRIVGIAFDKFPAANAIGRVRVKVPGGLLDSTPAP